jgi:AraC-like DNA-binding protein
MKKNSASTSSNISPKKAKVTPAPSVVSSEFHYLPSSEEMSSCGFYVTSLGQGRIEPGMQYPPIHHPSLYHFNWEAGRILPEFGLILVSEGRGIFESKPSGTVTVEAGMGILLFPGVWHRYRPDPQVGWTERWIQFNGKFAHMLLDSRIIYPENAALSLRSFQEAYTAFQLLLRSVNLAPASNSILFSLQALSVLSLAFGDRLVLPVPSNLGAGKPMRDSLVELALEYIWTRSHNVLSVSDVAEAVGVTRRTLERHMIEFTGRSVLEAIIDCRFLRAERLLAETDMPVKTITSLAGFGSVENMRHVFMQRTKHAPGEYRSQHRSRFRLPGNSPGQA